VFSICTKHNCFVLVYYVSMCFLSVQSIIVLYSCIMYLLIMQQSSVVRMVLNAKLFPKFEGNCIVILATYINMKAKFR